ncbi:MAG: hypothetical protein NVSMB51_12680 [Solirubrobacteraceae bacterium]
MTDDEQPFLDDDDPTPLGDTDEAHDELRSVDLPPGHPSQEEVKRRERAAGDMPGIPADGGEPPNSG